MKLRGVGDVLDAVSCLGILNTGASGLFREPRHDGLRGFARSRWREDVEVSIEPRAVRLVVEEGRDGGPDPRGDLAIERPPIDEAIGRGEQLAHAILARE